MSPRLAGNRWAGGGRGRGLGTTTTPPPPPPAARGPRSGGGGAPEGRGEGLRLSTAPQPRRAPPPRGRGSRPSEAGGLRLAGLRPRGSRAADPTPGQSPWPPAPLGPGETYPSPSAVRGVLRGGGGGSPWPGGRQRSSPVRSRAQPLGNPRGDL
ncbi:acidic proline-rich protein PRP25-like [Bubalus bubalis]|uniref:acidic proline-rich protein PRP25-like n=1 Tax=Bubalus bubalis TaxID=89462 RepID=UPI001D127C66|nr:acidic proline-rich protein PRP25-like [Bubalus bubalis]